MDQCPAALPVSGSTWQAGLCGLTMLQDDELGTGLPVPHTVLCHTLVQTFVGLHKTKNLQVSLILKQTTQISLLKCHVQHNNSFITKQKDPGLGQLDDCS